jgi:hypothetical protein
VDGRVERIRRAVPLGARERGQILPMVALLSVVLIALIGLALDVGRIMIARAELRRAVDAAALAGVLELPDMVSAETEVNNYMAENEPDAIVDLSSSPAERQVRVVAHKEVDLTFLSVLKLVPGLDLQDPVTISAEAVAGFGIVPVDTHLAIDATGSMGADPCNQGQNNDGCPIKEAKEAAQDFTDILMDDSPGASETQVGVGPFRGCYNPPRHGQGVNACVPVGHMVAELTDNKGLVHGKIQDITARGGTGTNVCWGMLEGQEDLFGPNGQTQSNTMRFLVLLSDGDNTYNNAAYSSIQDSPPSECRPSNPAQSDPYLGTECFTDRYLYPTYEDGQPWSHSDCNYYGCDWVGGYSGQCQCDYYDQTHEKAIDVQTRDLAAEMKSQGVEIYVVGFGVCDDDDGWIRDEEVCESSDIGNNDPDYIADRRLLKCIASSTEGTNDHYFEVPNAEDLPNVFSTIARDIAFRLIK